MAPAFSHLADRQCGLAGRASGPGSLAAPNAQRNLGPHGGLAPTNLMESGQNFPPPWSVEERPAVFVVRDHNGQPVAYVFFEEKPSRRSAAEPLTKDEARRIAANIAELPDFLANPKGAYRL